MRDVSELITATAPLLWFLLVCILVKRIWKQLPELLSSLATRLREAPGGWKFDPVPDLQAGVAAAVAEQLERKPKLLELVASPEDVIKTEAAEDSEVRSREDEHDERAAGVAIDTEQSSIPQNEDNIADQRNRGDRPANASSSQTEGVRGKDQRPYSFRRSVFEPHVAAKYLRLDTAALEDPSGAVLLLAEDLRTGLKRIVELVGPANGGPGSGSPQDLALYLQRKQILSYSVVVSIDRFFQLARSARQLGRLNDSQVLAILSSGRELLRLLDRTWLRVWGARLGPQVASALKRLHRAKSLVKDNHLDRVSKEVTLFAGIVDTIIPLLASVPADMKAEGVDDIRVLLAQLRAERDPHRQIELSEAIITRLRGSEDTSD